ncbi:MAG: FtsP/CotA-like multicopper oxidase with cupredoxin domain [Candidatus Poriferisodalaceae bacterium]
MAALPSAAETTAGDEMRKSPPSDQAGARTFFGFVFGVLFLIVAGLTVVGVAAGTNDGGAAVVVAPNVVQVSLAEFSVSGNLDIGSGPTILEVTNDGSAVHNLVAPDMNARTPDLSPGETYRLDLGFVSGGDYQIFCDIAGHTEAGMETTLAVSQAAASTFASADMDKDDHGDDRGDEATAEEWAELDQMMMDSMREFPAETEGIGNQPLEPTILPDGTKQFELTAEITKWEVEPGRIVDAWTYNGTVPGPEIWVDVGDKVAFVVHNELPLGTDIHWHGIRTPNEMDGVAPFTQDLIPSGETFTYEFVAERNAIGMYHAHHHGHVAIVNGLFATIQIGETPIPRGQTISGVTIPEDLEVAREIRMVTNDAGVIGFSLNGKSFPATEPYVFTEGDWFTATYYNEGLMAHPMHLHQFPQLVIAKDGIALDNPYYADTINVSPGERYTVLVHADTPGTWVWHCHIITHVERDGEMFGMVTAVIVEPK